MVVWLQIWAYLRPKLFRHLCYIVLNRTIIMVLFRQTKMTISVEHCRSIIWIAKLYSNNPPTHNDNDKQFHRTVHVKEWQRTIFNIYETLKFIDNVDEEEKSHNRKWKCSEWNGLYCQARWTIGWGANDHIHWETNEFKIWAADGLPRASYLNF